MQESDLWNRHFSAGERRALNIVWAAAGDYDLEPPFLAVRKDQADYYMNLMIGLSQKWLDRDALNGFFLSYQTAKKAEDFDALVWLALESYLYAKELPHRPVLSSLRREYADGYLNEDARLSRQQMMMKDPLVLDLQKYHWSSVAGGPKPRLSSHEKKVCSLIEQMGEEAFCPTSDDLILRLKEILFLAFHFSDYRMNLEHGFQATGPMKDLLERMLHRETHHIDSLLQRQDLSSGGSEERESSLLGAKGRHISEKSEADQAYIESCFGPCILSPRERKLMENDLCKGPHQYCSLWLTNADQNKTDPGLSAFDSSVYCRGGGEEKAGLHLSEKELVDQEVLEQAKRNQAFYQKNLLGIEASVKKLSAELETVLSSFFEPLPILGRAGRLDPRKTFRMPVLRDPEVFYRPGDEVENSLTVDLLLDASASRSPYQESIAAQAYVIAESLNRIHVESRILDFHSLRGFTVVQILKDYDSPDRTGIFSYAAAGWNRDGLALALTGRLIRNAAEKDGKWHLLLIMTDANPADSTMIPAEGKDIFRHSYGNEEGVQDTENAVKELRRQGLTLGAIYTGPNLYVKNVKRIYGSDFVRIEKVDQLAGGVSRLIQELLVKKGDRNVQRKEGYDLSKEG
ncbi:MAG: hypothetical protein PUC75_03990 [Lachnospiraceae bacterium]|nr:hypothetical protein [Lachnospiraceae bacterium]